MFACPNRRFKLANNAMKIIADVKKCCGHARCASVAEDIFTLDDSGYIAVAVINVVPGMETLARRGARSCPERALTVIEDTNGDPNPC